MNEDYGIFFDFEGVTIRLPINPEQLSIKTKSSNKTYELINLGEVNVLKDIPLREISFNGILPESPDYPWVLTKNDFKYPLFYLAKFREYKNNKKPIRFVVTRKTFITDADFETNMLVSIEDFSETEKAGSSGEWSYSINLKEYREYGVKKLNIQENNGKTQVVKTEKTRPTTKTIPKAYTVKSNDTLWDIAKKELNDGSKYTQIYSLNKTNIDNKNKSTGGSKYTIYAGQVLKLA